MRTYQKCPRCLVKPVVVSSKMAKAEPISNGGSTIGDNVFKKKQLLLYKKIIVAREKRSKNMREEQLYRHQVQ